MSSTPPTTPPQHVTKTIPNAPQKKNKSIDDTFGLAFNHNITGTVCRRLQLSTGSSNPPVSAFISINLNLGKCYADGGKNRFRHRQQQTVIGINNTPDIDDYYLENQCWFIGCYFVNNPFDKSISIYDFEELFRSVMLKLGFNEEGKRYFTGDTYEQLFVQIEKMMDRLITTLDETKGGKKWSYEKDDGDEIKLNLQKIDQFLNKNNKKQMD